MKGQVRPSIPAIVAAVMLVGCASKGPVSSPGTASARAESDISSEYQSLVDNASSQIVCRSGAITGSRIQKRECLTLAEIEARREQAVELMREMQARGAIVMPDRPPDMPQSTAPTTP
jgi:hypothetical protein